MLSVVCSYRYVWLIAAPVILAIGVAANAVQFLLLRRRGAWRTSSNVLLTMMSAAHLAVLVTGLMLQWLDNGYGFSPAEWSPGVCRWTSFLRHGSMDVAAWLLVGLVMSAALPEMTPITAVIYSASAMGAACVKNAILFWTNGPVFDASGRLVSVCGTPERFAQFDAIARPWLFHCLGVLLPSVVVVVLSVLLLLGVNVDKLKQGITAEIAPLCTVAKARLNKLSKNPMPQNKPEVTTTETATAAINDTNNNNNNNTMISNEVKLLAVYLTASFVCHVGVPSTIVMFLSRAPTENGPDTDLGTAVVRMVKYVYFSSSFLAFCIAGHVDWAEFIAVMRRKPTPAELRAAEHREKMREWLRNEAEHRMGFYSVHILPVNHTDHLTVETISASVDASQETNRKDDGGLTTIGVLP